MKIFDENEPLVAYKAKSFSNKKINGFFIMLFVFLVISLFFNLFLFNSLMNSKFEIENYKNNTLESY